MNPGSMNLRRYRHARRAGDTMHTACVKSGIQLSEARLIDADDARNPPPPECYTLPDDTNDPEGDGSESAEIASAFTRVAGGQPGGPPSPIATGPVQSLPVAISPASSGSGGAGEITCDNWRAHYA